MAKKNKVGKMKVGKLALEQRAIRAEDALGELEHACSKLERFEFIEATNCVIGITRPDSEAFGCALQKARIALAKAQEDAEPDWASLVG